MNNQGNQFDNQNNNHQTNMFGNNINFTNNSTVNQNVVYQNNNNLNNSNNSNNQNILMKNILDDSVQDSSSLYKEENNNQNQNDDFNNQSNNNIINKVSYKSLLFLLILIIFVIFVLISIVLYISKNNSINKSKNVNFVENAKEFIESAKDYAIKSGIVNCEIETNKQISLVNLINGKTTSVSPYGNRYDLDESYVKINLSAHNGVCNYKYYIYITDGIYQIGLKNNPIYFEKLSVSDVKLIKNKTSN